MNVGAASGTILIVDDDADVRDTLCSLLEDEGYTVSCAENGRNALRMLEDGDGPLRPSLILLDLMMPVMNGWEFLTAIEGRPHLESLPIVVFTAKSALKDEDGPVTTRPRVHKPIDVDLLLEMVRELCELRNHPEEAPSNLMPNVPSTGRPTSSGRLAVAKNRGRV